MGDKGAYRKLLVSFYKRGEIRNMIKAYKIFSIDLNKNRLIFCDTQGEGENNCKIIESGDLKVLLKWILLEES